MIHSEVFIHNKSITLTSFEILKQKLQTKLQNKYEIELLDGIKFKINENSWALIRKSNTEDIFRISIESDDESMITSLQKNIIKLLNESYEEIK